MNPTNLKNIVSLPDESISAGFSRTLSICLSVWSKASRSYIGDFQLISISLAGQGVIAGSVCGRMVEEEKKGWKNWTTTFTLIFSFFLFFPNAWMDSQ